MKHTLLAAVLCFVGFPTISVSVERCEMDRLIAALQGRDWYLVQAECK